MKLNLGAGNRILPNYINHDKWKHRKEIDCVYDLNNAPWSIWQDNQFESIQFISVIEHLKLDFIESLNECWRILQPNGVLSLKFPINSSPTIRHDPTHRWFLDPECIQYVDPDTKYGKQYNYTPYKWRIIDLTVIKNRSVAAELKPRK
jgi:ubiquinone/menaquinone biosynthesis C-methylase UbiE